MPAPKQAANENWAAADLPEGMGNTLWVPHTSAGKANPNRSGGGGGDDMTPLWRLDVRRDVQIAKWGVLALATVFLGALWFLLAQIDNRFDRADEKVSVASDKVADLRVEIAGQRGDIKAILGKLDDQSQTGTRQGQAQPVHQGTGSRP